MIVAGVPPCSKRSRTMKKTNYTLNGLPVYVEYGYNPIQSKNFILGFYLYDKNEGVYTLINRNERKNFQGTLGLDDIEEL